MLMKCMMRARGERELGVSPVTLMIAPEQVGAPLALTTQRPGPARAGDTCL